MADRVVKITKEAWNKLWQYIFACDLEIEGIGHAYLPKERDPQSTDKSVIIEDLFILKQQVSSASADIDDEYIHTMLYEKTKAKDFRPFNFWWHSHAKMKTFFSGTDEGTIAKFGNAPWMIHFVGNHRMEYECKITYYKPIRFDLEDVKVEIINGSMIEVSPEIKKEVDELVTRRTYFYKPNERHGNHRTWKDFDDDTQWWKRNRGDTMRQGSFFGENARGGTGKDEPYEPEIADRVWVECEDGEWREAIVRNVIRNRGEADVFIKETGKIIRADKEELYPVDQFDIVPIADGEDKPTTYDDLEANDHRLAWGETEWSDHAELGKMNAEMMRLIQEKKDEEALQIANQMMALNFDIAVEDYQLEGIVDELTLRVMEKEKGK